MCIQLAYQQCEINEETDNDEALIITFICAASDIAYWSFSQIDLLGICFAKGVYLKEHKINAHGPLLREKNFSKRVGIY